MCKGNPCIVMSGNKHQVERDYSGPNGLSFVRSYNSKYAYAYNDATNDRFEPLGIGWAGSYLQHLRYSMGGAVAGHMGIPPEWLRAGLHGGCDRRFRLWRRDRRSRRARAGREWQSHRMEVHHRG
ncbi:DUF6531 domain-containing protein [Steroidobacter agaridevorans]